MIRQKGKIKIILVDCNTNLDTKKNPNDLKMGSYQPLPGNK